MTKILLKNLPRFSLVFSACIFSFQGKLWISYFDEGATVPPPFNMVPTPKFAIKVLTCKKKSATRATEEEKKAAETRYFG
jgi:hypothetical protein